MNTTDTETKRSDAATRLHHPFSPSSLQCRENSPCWAPLPDSSSEASERGTAQHDAVDAPSIPDDMSDPEAMAVEACKQYFADHLAKCPGTSVPLMRGGMVAGLETKKAHLINEIYVAIDDRLITDSHGNEFMGTTGGYLDRAFVSPDETYAEIFDWKFGQWSVEPAANNVQGISYLLGLVKLFPKLQTVKVHFVMPHRDEVESHTFTTDKARFESACDDYAAEGAFGGMDVSLHEPQFLDLRLRITTIVERARLATANQDFSKCSARASACLFCGNLARCTTVADFALRLGKKYAPLQMPDNITPSLVVDPSHTRARLEAASVMSNWAQAVRKQETDKCIADEDWLPADYILRSRSSTSIVDQNLVIEIAKKTGITDEQVEAAKEISLTPLKKDVRALAARGSKETAEEAFTTALIDAKAIERGEPSVWLERLKS